MNPYLSVAFLVTTLALLDVFKVKNRQVLAPILFAILFLFLSLRDGIGEDYYGYKFSFERTSISNAEIGYYFVQDVCKRIYNNFHFMIAVFGFVSIYAKIVAFKALSPLLFVSILYYFGYYYLTLDLNQIRQGLALGICLLSINYIIKKSKTKFLITIILAALFHVSSFIFMPAYFLFHRLKYKSYSLVLMVSLSFSLLFIDSKLVIYELILLTHTFIPLDIIRVKLDYYQHYPKEGFYLGSLFLMFFSYLFIYYKDIVNNKVYRGILNCFLFGVFLNFFFNSMFGFIRLSYYYLILGGILYAYVISVERKMVFKIVWFIILALIMGLKYINYIISNSSSYIPYKTLFFQ